MKLFKSLLSLLSGFGAAINAVLDPQSAKALLGPRLVTTEPVKPFTELEIQIPGGERVTFKRGGGLFMSLPAEGNVHCVEPDDEMGWAHFEYRRFNLYGNEAYEASADRWGSFLACLISGHSSKLEGFKLGSREFYNNGCACGYLHYRDEEDDASTRIFPLLELAARFARYKNWEGVTAANDAMDRLSAAFSISDPALYVEAARLTVEARQVLSYKLYRLRSEAVKAYNHTVYARRSGLDQAA